MNLKNEKGSITVYVLVAVFFLMAVLVGRFIIANRNLKVQYDSLAKVKSLYETNAKRYEEYVDPDDPNGSGSTEGTQREHQIYIFNREAFDFFNGKSTNQTSYCVYQSGLVYVLRAQDMNQNMSNCVLVQDSQKYKFTYKLMSDIAVSYSGEDVLKMPIMSKLDFNNHIIYSSAYNEVNEGNFAEYNYNAEYVFWDGSKPAVGKVSK